MTAATASTEALWGVGTFVGPDAKVQPWEISNAEIGRDMGAATRVLEHFGVGPGNRVMLCSMLTYAKTRMQRLLVVSSCMHYRIDGIVGNLLNELLSSVGTGSFMD